MKRTIILLAAMLSMVCVAKAQPKDENKIDENKPIEQIDEELDALMHKLKESIGNYEALYPSVRALKERLEHYLPYPQTFESDMPLTKEHMSIEEHPLMGHKIYTFWYYEGGTMGYTYEVYIQYRDESGKVTFIPFYNDLRYPMFFDFIEFSHDGVNYYFVRGCAQGYSCCWFYSCSIITIEDGVIVHHPEFFPKELDFKPSVEEYFIYDENGEIVSNDERPGYFFTQCGTQYGNQEVALDFDPETLVVTVHDEEYDVDKGGYVVVKSKWRLNVDGE